MLSAVPRAALLLGAFTTAVGAQADTSRQARLERTIPLTVLETAERIYNAEATLRLRGTNSIDSGRVVAGDVAAADGALSIAGTVRGSVVALNTDVSLAPGARVDGDLVVLGGGLEGTRNAEVGGSIRVYAAGVVLRLRGTQTVLEETDPPVEEDHPDARWWRSRERWSARSWTDLRLLSARTYNRVEGLPIFVGPSIGRDLGWARVRLDALGVVRTVGRFDRAEHTFGHNVRLEFELGEHSGVRAGARLFDIVDPVEDWHLSDGEVGLATFLLHRDYRDYFNRHGGAVYAGVYLTPASDFIVSFSDQRWAARDTRDPFTLFRNGDGWRPNPRMDDGSLHILAGTVRFDTRNDVDDPWSGWFITADVERGQGTLTALGPASLHTRAVSPGRMQYARGFLDVRRYNRISPDAQVNLRVVMGGWLGGDPLPLQRRFSVGGPGTLPGFDFRRPLNGPDVLTCAAEGAQIQGNRPSMVAGTPAQCDRVALAQLEVRGDLRIDPFGVFDDDWRPWRQGYGRGAQWVIFADAGRGWLVTPRASAEDLTYPTNRFPKPSTFRTDIGVGLVLDNIGFYVAKALSDSHLPVNFFVRLKPRF